MRPPRRARSPSRRLRDLLEYHATLLADAPRNRAFARALRARVRPGASVLDLGAGTGLWAVLAARLGARRVVAVERERLLVPVIERLARENGVGERVSVVAAEARRLRLPRAFDVVVSETVGNEGFDEGIVPLLTRARERFLKRGGRLIPEVVSLMAAPVSGGFRLRPPLLACRTFRDLVLQLPRLVPSTRLPHLAHGSCLLRADLRVARPPLVLENLAARFRLRDGRRLGGFALWVEMELAPGVRLSTREADSWWLTVLPAEPAGRGPCTVDLELSKGRRGMRWRVAVRQRGRTEVRDHSPLFAYGALSALTAAGDGG